MDGKTWERIYDQYAGIENTSLRNAEVFPAANTATVQQVSNMRRNPSSGRHTYAQTTTMTQFPGKDLSFGVKDAVKQEVIR